MSASIPISIWQNPPQPLVLEDDEVHVWRVALDQPVERLEALERTLSPDELERAGRFYFQRDREHYIIGRGCLRDILSRYINAKPADLSFLYTHYGKPSLARGFTQSELRFNLSHSGDLGLIAVAHHRELGVDIERIRPELAGEGIANHYFSRAEVTVLQALQAEMQMEAFYTCWTRKEAYIKARGEGLSLPLEQFDVTLVPGEPAVLIATRPDPEEAGRWTLHALDPGAGYVAALAVEGQGYGVRCWEFEEA